MKIVLKNIVTSSGFSTLLHHRYYIHECVPTRPRTCEKKHSQSAALVSIVLA